MKYRITNPANGKSVIANTVRWNTRQDQGRDLQITCIGNEIRTYFWYRPMHPFVALLDSVLSEIATQVFPCPV